MSALPAYSRYSDYSSAAPERQFQPQRRINVVPGGSPSAQPQGVFSLAATLKLVAVIALVLLAVCFARVALVSASVSTQMESKTISSQLNTARNTGNDLEVAQSSLSNPSRIKSEATALGMHAPIETEAIYLQADVVSIDASGNLSLAQSIRLASKA